MVTPSHGGGSSPGVSSQARSRPTPSRRPSGGRRSFSWWWKNRSPLKRKTERVRHLSGTSGSAAAPGTAAKPSNANSSAVRLTGAGVYARTEATMDFVVSLKIARFSAI